jgi:hypothetical protein
VLPSFVEEGDSVRGYLKGVFGGILAVLAAFGWTVTLAFLVALKFQKQDQAYGISISAINGPALWIVLFLIFRRRLLPWIPKSLLTKVQSNPLPSAKPGLTSTAFGE